MLNDVVVQRTLTVGATDYTAKAQSEGVPSVVDEVFFEILTTAISEDMDLYNAISVQEAATKAQLTKWIEHTPGIGFGKNPVYGRKSQFRKYADFLDLARGLIGWVEAKPGRHDEKLVANEIYLNPAADALLSSLMTKIHAALSDVRDTTGAPDVARMQKIKEELSADLVKATTAGGTDVDLGTYRKNRSASINPLVWQPGSSTWAALENPDSVPFREKILILHDLMEHLMTRTAKTRTPETAASGLVPEVGELDFTTDIRGVRGTKDRGMGLTSSTRDEKNPGTVFARKHKIPVWASQSYTTARMLNMAQWAEADKLEKASLAWGIFAFWRNDYNHTSIAYHTLHEVMDVAAHYDVAYDPLDPYAAGHSWTLKMLFKPRWTTSCRCTGTSIPSSPIWQTGLPSPIRA